MPTTVVCHHCHEPLSLEETGSPVVCPACQRVVDLRLAVPAISVVATESKTCPMCGKSIRLGAQICRYCGEPQWIGQRMWRDGSLLVMTHDADLPYICIKTGQPASGWLNRTLYWHPRSVFLYLLLGPLYLLMAALLYRCVRIHIALSPACFYVRHACALAAVILGFGVFFLLGPMPELMPNIELYLLATLPLCAVLFLMLVRYADMVHAHRITREHVWLSGVHRSILDRLPDWATEGLEGTVSNNP